MSSIQCMASTNCSAEHCGENFKYSFTCQETPTMLLHHILDTLQEIWATLIINKKGFTLKRQAEKEEISWEEEWETPCRRWWAGAQRSTPVPVGPIPTRITTKPVHTSSSLYLSVCFSLTSPQSPSSIKPPHLLFCTQPPPHPKRRGADQPTGQSVSTQTLITREDQWGISKD